MLKVTVTKAHWNGRDYVAYMLVEWGNLRGLQGFAPVGGSSNWNGVVKVDDGEAYVVQTIDFEQPIVAGGQSGGLYLTPKQAKKLAELRQDLDEELVKAALKRDRKVAKAYNEIHNRAKLARELRKIEQKYANKVADAQIEFDEEVAKLLANARANNVIVAGDKLIATGDDDKVKWQAGVNGGTDGILIKLILDDDDAEITVRAGGQKIEFETTPQIAARVVVHNTGVRATVVAGSVRVQSAQGRRYYSGQNRGHSRPMRHYRPPTRHQYVQQHRGRAHGQSGHQCANACGGSTTVRRGVTSRSSVGSVRTSRYSSSSRRTGRYR